MGQVLVRTMRQHGHIFFANAAVKVVAFLFCICCSSHERATQFNCAPNYPNFCMSASIGIFCVAHWHQFCHHLRQRFNRVRHSTRGTLLHGLYVARNIIQTCKQPNIQGRQQRGYMWMIQSQYFTFVKSSRICPLSSAETDQHRVAS